MAAFVPICGELLLGCESRCWFPVEVGSDPIKFYDFQGIDWA